MSSASTKRDYIDALERVPVVTHQRVEQTMRFLADLVGMLGELRTGRHQRDKDRDVLRSSEAALEEAQAMARLGRWELDLVHQTGLNGRATASSTCSRSTSDEFAASYEAFLGGDPPETDAAVDRRLLTIARGPSPCDIVHRLLMTDGRVKWVRDQCRTEYAQDGTPLRSLGIIQDITERRSKERALRQSQRLYETFINATDDMAFLKDDELALYVIINEANAAFFGLGVAEVVGRTDADLMPAAGREKLPGSATRRRCTAAKSSSPTRK